MGECQVLMMSVPLALLFRLSWHKNTEVLQCWPFHSNISSVGYYCWLRSQFHCQGCCYYFCAILSRSQGFRHFSCFTTNNRVMRNVSISRLKQGITLCQLFTLFLREMYFVLSTIMTWEKEREIYCKVLNRVGSFGTIPGLIQREYRHIHACMSSF